MTWNNDSIRQLERDSIREFVASCSEFLGGRVLDLGAGLQPYREIVEGAGGEYIPFDAPSFPASVAQRDTTGSAWGERYDTLLCTQVIQYVEEPAEWLAGHRTVHLRRGGVLVLTGPTTWPEVEPGDLYRLTRAGLRRILVDAGFSVERLESRAALPFEGFELSLGYGAVARA